MGENATVQESPSPQAKEPSTQHIPSLDGIRAASFLVVFLSHAGLKGVVPGYFGLSLFFFLSGYLITTLLRREFDRTATISLKSFYLRRVLRIFPPFYLVLLIGYAITLLGWWDGSISAEAVVAQFAHATNYYVIERGWWEGLSPGSWVYWSLAVEEHFYLVFPLLFVWLSRRGYSGREQAVLLLALCILVLAWRCILVFGLGAPKDRMYVASDTRIDSILFGCILAVWHNPVLDRDGPTDRSLAWLWLPVGAAMVLLSLVYRRFEFEQTFRYTLQSAGLLPFFIAAIRWHDRGPLKLLGTRPFRYLGLLSYSMYLTHTSVIYGFESWTRWPEPVRAAAAFLTCVVLGDLIYRAVERPMGRWRKRLQLA
jgi:peptidoglycan/LPS O-acetylase OafA/YrhL